MFPYMKLNQHWNLNIWNLSCRCTHDITRSHVCECWSWKTVVFVVTTITRVYGHQNLVNLLFVKESQHWSIEWDGTPFAKDTLGSSNPSFGAFKHLNRAIMQYTCYWYLVGTEKNRGALILILVSVL